MKALRALTIPVLVALVVLISQSIFVVKEFDKKTDDYKPKKLKEESPY